MNNRLAEIGNTHGADSPDDDLEAANCEVELAPTMPDHMKQFFRTIQAIKTDIVCVQQATRSIEEINEAALLATTTDGENRLSKKLKLLIVQTSKRALETKRKLDILQEETKLLMKENTATGSDLRSVYTFCHVISDRDSFVFSYPLSTLTQRGYPQQQSTRKSLQYTCPQIY